MVCGFDKTAAGLHTLTVKAPIWGWYNAVTEWLLLAERSEVKTTIAKSAWWRRADSVTRLVTPTQLQSSVKSSSLNYDFELPLDVHMFFLCDNKQHCLTALVSSTCKLQATCCPTLLSFWGYQGNGFVMIVGSDPRQTGLLIWSTLVGAGSDLNDSSANSSWDVEMSMSCYKRHELLRACRATYRSFMWFCDFQYHLTVNKKMWLQHSTVDSL